MEQGSLYEAASALQRALQDNDQVEILKGYETFQRLFNQLLREMDDFLDQ